MPLSVCSNVAVFENGRNSRPQKKCGIKRGYELSRAVEDLSHDEPCRRICAKTDTGWSER